MIKVLVTALGTAAATAIAVELKKNYKDIYVVGADINEKYQISTSIDVDEFFKFPSSVSDREAYFKYVLEFCIEHEIGFIFSTIDEEVYDLAKKRSLFEENGIKLCIPDFETVEICHLKNKFSKWVKKNIPEIYIQTFSSTDEIMPDDFPIFVKPIEGRASIGCHTIENCEDFNAFKNSYDIRDFVIQKKCSGDIITVDLVRDRKNTVINMCQRIETLRNGSGCGIAVEITDYKDLNKICTELAEKLDLNGVVNAEFFKTDNGYKIIEVNPRFSAGTLFSCIAGVNIVCCAFDITKGRKMGNMMPVVGKRFAKRYEVYEL